jgi:hypothetical protein
MIIMVDVINTNNSTNMSKCKKKNSLIGSEWVKKLGGLVQRSY